MIDIDAPTQTTAPQRLVLLAVNQRQVALWVDAVLAIRELGEQERVQPLLRTPMLAELGTLDAELLFVLQTAQLLPSESVSL